MEQQQAAETAETEAEDIKLAINPYWHMFNALLDPEPRKEIDLIVYKTCRLPWIVTQS